MLHVADTRLELYQGDITRLAVDAIVNAANASLLGGGGVDGAIHRAAGPKLRDACARLSGCKTGEAKITKGYALAAPYVIHTVGPVYRNGHSGEAELLASCYRSSMRLAHAHHLASIAFPAISTGAYGYPLQEAARIALDTVIDCLRQQPLSLTRVVFALYGVSLFTIYQSELAARSPNGQ